MARSPRAFFSPVARFALMSSMAAFSYNNGWSAASTRARLISSINTSGFRDATHHWRKINEPERVMQPLPDQPDFGATRVVVVGELSAGVEQADAELELRRPRLVELMRDGLQRAVHPEHDRLPNEFGPLSAVATLLDQ